MKALKGKRLRKGNAALLVCGSAVLAAGIGYGISRISPVRLYSTSPKVEIGEPFNARANISSVLFGNVGDVQIQGVVDSNQPGIYTIEYIYKGRSWPVQVEVADFTPPRLELKNLTVGLYDDVDAESFVDSIQDDSKVSLSINNPINLVQEEGTRSISITALDEFGNKTTKKAKLTRIIDTTTPGVLNKETTRKLLVGSDFEPVNLDIDENTDLECEVDVNTSSLNMDEPGKYTVTYTVTDSSGNSTTWQETIYVVTSFDDPIPDDSDTGPRSEESKDSDSADSQSEDSESEDPESSVEEEN